LKSPVSKTLAVVVTADVCIAIATHWKSYDLIGKFVGIVLLVSLAVGLRSVFMKPREGERYPGVSFAVIACSWLLLATFLFNGQA
jgi:hypothetical protein